MICAGLRGRSRRAATANISCGFSKRDCSSEGHPDRDRGGSHPRAESLRRRARLLSGKLQPQGVPRGHRPGRGLRAGQPLELEARRAARPALSDPAGARQDRPGHRRRDLRRRGRHPARLADLRQVGHVPARCRVQAPGLGPAPLPTLPSLGEFLPVSRSELDLANASSIRAAMRKVRPGVIVNAAAYPAVDRAESEEPLARAVNRDGPAVLAEEAALLGALLVHFSTDYVFDGEKASAYDETDAPNPLNAY